MKQQSWWKAWLGVAVTGLAVLAAPGRAAAAPLAFCFNSITSNCFTEQVQYSACGGAFHTLYEFTCNGGFFHATKFGCCSLAFSPGCPPHGFTLLTCQDVKTMSFKGALNSCGCGQSMFVTSCEPPTTNSPNTVCETNCSEVVNFHLSDLPANGSVCWNACLQGFIPGVSPNFIFNTGTFDFTVNAVPEPSTYGSLVGGLGLLWLARKRRSAKQ